MRTTPLKIAVIPWSTEIIDSLLCGLHAFGIDRQRNEGARLLAGRLEQQQLGDVLLVVCIVRGDHSFSDEHAATLEKLLVFYAVLLHLITEEFDDPRGEDPPQLGDESAVLKELPAQVQGDVFTVDNSFDKPAIPSKLN